MLLIVCKDYLLLKPCATVQSAHAACLLGCKVGSPAAEQHLARSFRKCLNPNQHNKSLKIRWARMSKSISESHRLSTWQYEVFYLCLQCKYKYVITFVNHHTQTRRDGGEKTRLGWQQVPAMRLVQEPQWRALPLPPPTSKWPSQSPPSPCFGDTMDLAVNREETWAKTIKDSIKPRISDDFCASCQQCNKCCSCLFLSCAPLSQVLLQLPHSLQLSQAHGCHFVVL